MRDFQRSLTAYLQKHPTELDKMIFVTGPRQVGKTTLLQSWPKGLSHPRSFYLNWDIPEDRKILRSNNLSFFLEKIIPSQPAPFFLLDEIHKYSRWKNYLKGLYDAVKGRAAIAVTGSARLDIFRRGGDSMMGRYWLFHLDPLTLAEILGTASFSLPEIWAEKPNSKMKEAYQTLFRQGGFPDPFFKLDEAGHRRWSLLRKEILMKEDLRDLTRIQEMALVENLLEILPLKIGSPFSLNSVREDLEVSHSTLKNWLQWLESLYYFFSIPVYSKKLARSLKKEKKIYLYDWAEIIDPGQRFENLVAVHLLKAIHAYREMSGINLSLHYLRDKEKREVDFLILKDSRPWMLIEAKLSADPNPASLLYYAERLRPPHVILLTHEWGQPEWKINKGNRYWHSPAGLFFSNWV